MRDPLASPPWTRVGWEAKPDEQPNTTKPPGGGLITALAELDDSENGGELSRTFLRLFFTNPESAGSRPPGGGFFSCGAVRLTNRHGMKLPPARPSRQRAFEEKTKLLRCNRQCDRPQK